MGTHEYEKPWQIMPAKIIKLALEHVEKGNDFNHQVAFLLLDIGVETALKVYLINKGHAIGYIKFPDLIKKVKVELSKGNSDLANQLDDANYLHRFRNTLYHQGDGLKPTEDYLKKYVEIAKKIVETMLEVNLQTEERDFAINMSEQLRLKFEELVLAIENRFKYFQESCAIVTEKLRPKYGTREFAMQLGYIFHNWPDAEDADPRVRIENQVCRLQKFNELTGRKIEDHDFVDILLEDIRHLYVIVAFKEISDNVQDDWEQYLNIFEKQPRLLSDWKRDVYQERLTYDDVREECQKMVSWIEAKQEKLDDWISSNMGDVYRMRRPIDSYDWLDFF